MEFGDNLDQAVGLAGMDLPVFFLAKGSKVPEAGSAGFHGATTDEDEIWEAYSPEKNLAIATGGPRNLIVLDLDVYKPEGAASAKRLLDEHGVLPTTVVAYTGRGGKHYYFWAPEPVASGANIGGYKGIDLKSDGGYVVAPPSVVGKPYAWAPGLDPWTTEIADAPQWLADLCRKRRAKDLAEPATLGWRETKIRGSQVHQAAERAGFVLGWAEDKGDPRGKCLVRCPGEKLHSTETASSHSFLFVGDEDAVLFSCYHGSCETDSPPTVAFLEACLEAVPEAEEKSEAPEEWRYVPISKLEPRSLDDWLWTGFVAPGRLTILSAEPKAGKTTFLACLYRAFAQDGEYLGQPIRKTKVLVASEESPDNWLSRREQIGLDDHVLVSAQPPIEVGGWDTWAAFCLHTKRQALELGAGVVAFDTANFLFPTEDENSVADTKRALESVAIISRAGVAVIFAAHTRKSGGDAISSLRGSSALAGAADFVLTLGRATDRIEDTRRVIIQRGRYVESPAKLTVDYDSTGYAMTSVTRSVEEAGARKRILAALPVAPDRGVSLTTVRAACRGNVAARQVETLLLTLLREGEVERFPAGVQASHETWRRI